MGENGDMKSIGAALAALALATLAGCATAPPRATAPATSPASAPATAPVPTLGQPAGLFASGQGFGQVRPARIFNGGDPTGLVTHVVWRSWGGPQAVAAGVSDWVGPGQSVATGTPEPVRVVAFRLGACGGRVRYRALEWYFPQHGQHFDASRYEDICHGAYVPAP